MALTTVVATPLVLDTPSASLLDAAMTAITHAVDGCTVDLSAYLDRPILFKLEDSAGCTVVMQQGDRPPSQRAGLGATGTEMPTGLDITLTANQVKYIVLELSRFLQDDQTVHFLTGTTTSSCSVFVLPKAV